MCDLLQCAVSSSQISYFVCEEKIKIVSISFIYVCICVCIHTHTCYFRIGSGDLCISTEFMLLVYSRHIC